MRHVLRPLLIALSLSLPATFALAQHHGEGDIPQYDPVMAPLILPVGDDFLPPPPLDPVAPDFKPSPVSLGAYMDVSSDLKLFNLAPSYTFSERLAVKVRVPLIFERTLHYFEHEASAGGLGDIAIDTEYTHRFAAPGRALRVQASVKLPTGDDEKLDDEDYRVPLGTGSVDLLARVQYAQSTARTGFLVTGLFRKNTSGETISQYVDPSDPDYVETTTIRVTNGNQFVGAAFARHRVTERLWLHLGAGLMLTGDGKVEEEWRATGGASPYDDEFPLLQKSTLVDLFPGVSWNLGSLSPYLGVRLPLVTSYDDDFREESRDTAFILQVSYRPERLFAGN
jgi:hypothetical protein